MGAHVRPRGGLSVCEAKKSISWGVSLSAVQEAQWCARGCDDAHRRAHSWHSEMQPRVRVCDRANLSVASRCPRVACGYHMIMYRLSRGARGGNQTSSDLWEVTITKQCYCPSAPVRIRRAYYLFVFAGRGVVSYMFEGLHGPSGSAQGRAASPQKSPRSHEHVAAVTSS